MRILGIDYGQRKIGLATGDTELGIATPLETISVKTLDDAFAYLEELVKEEDIEKVVVGRPVNMSNQATKQTDTTEDFVRYLKENMGLAVELIDERLTSVAAAKINKDDDKIAAQMILQIYFDKIKNQNG